MKILLLITLISFLLPSIFSGCRCVCACKGADLEFGLVGYTDTEADTIIFRKFEKNTNFSVRKDTFLAEVSSLRFTRSSDTLNPAYSNGIAILSISTYDYEMFFPATQNLYRFSDFAFRGPSDKNCGCFSNISCVIEIKSFKLNNNIISLLGFNFIYLHK